MTVSARRIYQSFTWYDALNKPLSLYIHIRSATPSATTAAALKIITKDKSRADAYIEYLEKEMELLAPHLNGQHQACPTALRRRHALTF